MGGVQDLFSTAQQISEIEELSGHNLKLQWYHLSWVHTARFYSTWIPLSLELGSNQKSWQVFKLQTLLQVNHYNIVFLPSTSYKNTCCFGAWPENVYLFNTYCTYRKIYPSNSWNASYFLLLQTEEIKYSILQPRDLLFKPHVFGIASIVNSNILQK